MDAPEKSKPDEAEPGQGEQLCALCGAYWQCGCTVKPDATQGAVSKKHSVIEDGAVPFPTWL